MTVEQLDEMIEATRQEYLRLADLPSSFSVEGQSASFDSTSVTTRLDKLLELKAKLFPYEIQTVAG